MMSLKTQIQQIINDRKSRVSKIQSEIDNIGKLSSSLEEVAKKIEELKFDDGREYLKIINAKIEELSEAKVQALLLKKRFDKETVNIGVSGFTHAGKSTLLQAISGLSDSEIPKADPGSNSSLHPTTAICSQIFNSADERAEITFKKEDQFVDFINAHIEVLGIDKIKHYTEVETLNIPDPKDAEPEKNTIIERLQEIKESFGVYRNLINSSVKPLRRDEFTELSNYVSYQKEEKLLRYFPAVQEVKIYCKFPSFDASDADTKLCLVDLPGFGEFDAVDEIQIKGLKEIVDHIAFIYQTNPIEGIGNKKYRDCQSIINKINKDLKDNQLAFESFIINIDKRDENWENLTNQTKSEIINRYGNYDQFAFSAFKETDKSKQTLISILGKLATTLPKMDDELLRAYGKNRDLTEVTRMVISLIKQINQLEFQNEDASKFTEKGRLFRENFSFELRKLLGEYQANVADEDFESEVCEIQDRIDERLKDDLMYVPTKERPTWNEYVEKAAKGGMRSLFAPELHRIWTGIINEYANLDAIFADKLSTLKKRILSIFVKLTGNLIQNKEADNFNEILEKLSIISDNQIYKAFKLIDGQKQDFRQNLYPFVFKNHVNNLMEDKMDGSVFPNGVADLDPNVPLTPETLKAQLYNISKGANYQISKTIIGNFVSSYFLIGVLHTFNENITYSKTENDDDFVKFCSIFRSEIYEEYGSQSNSVKLAELKTALEEVKEIIVKF